MSAPEHSPLPWRIGASCLIVDADGNPIYACTDDPDDTRVSADADLIITAVNSHAELLSAAKVALDALSDFDVTPDLEMTDDLVKSMQNGMEDLQAAIAKAEQAS